jgi:predicted transcriptional regulator
MENQISDRISQMNDVFDDINSIRVLLYLDEYNPNVLLTDLEKNLGITNDSMVKIVTKLISLDLVKKENDMYHLAELGKLTVGNLKKI